MDTIFIIQSAFLTHIFFLLHKPVIHGFAFLLLYLFLSSHLPHLRQNITSSLTPALCAPVLSCFLWGDKLAQQRTMLPLLSSKQESCLSGKIQGQVLQRISSLPLLSTLLLSLLLLPPSGQRSMPAVSTWLVPSKHSHGAMSHSLTPSQIPTV